MLFEVLVLFDNGNVVFTFVDVVVELVFAILPIGVTGVLLVEEMVTLLVGGADGFTTMVGFEVTALLDPLILLLLLIVLFGVVEEYTGLTNSV